MRSILALAATAAVTIGGLSACSGAHGASSALPAGAARSAQTHVRHLKSERSLKDVSGGSPTFSLLLALFDAPLTGISTANAQFNAGILGVDAIDQSGNSWQLTGGSTPQVVNLFALQSTSLDLGGGTLPSGTYPYLQLLLDPATTTLTFNGQTYPAYFVSPDHPWWDPTQTIETVMVPLSVSGTAGQSIQATLDFNVFQSADLRDGVVYLTPTVAAGIGQSSISGSIANAAGAPVENATIVATDANGKVANVTASHADGSFTLRGVGPGNYTVSVQNSFVTNAGATVDASGADAGAAPTRSIVVGPSSQIQLGTLQD